jgi:hypothetical protein
MSNFDQAHIKAGTVGRFMEYDGESARVSYDGDVDVLIKVQDLVKCTVKDE